MAASACRNLKNKIMKLVILDRDGVINHDPTPTSSRRTNGARSRAASGHRAPHARGLPRDRRHQPVGRGARAVRHGHARQDTTRRCSTPCAPRAARLDGIFFCPHAPDDGCHCRKPEPGLYEEIADRLKIGLNGVYAVGDLGTRRGRGAGRGGAPGAGAHRQGERTLRKGKNLGEVPVFADLAAFVDGLLLSRLSND